MTERTINIEVLRYRPEQSPEPEWQSYQVPSREDWVLLDGLNYIKDHVDGTLSFRWSCHMAVCGSCGVMLNGDPTLGCKAFLRDLPDTIQVAPLSNLPVYRDLVTDMEGFTEKLAQVKPYIIAEETEHGDEGSRQLPAELAIYRQYTMCINCLLCYAACPQVGLNPDYLGPAALALAHRYNLDSRDSGRREREETTASDEGVWECTFVGECTEVCPKDVDPAGAIQQMKLASSMDWLIDKLTRRRKS